MKPLFKKPLLLCTVSAIAAALLLSSAVPASAEINLPPEKLRIYESASGLDFPGTVILPGSGGTRGGTGGAGGGSGAGEGKGGDSGKGGDKKAPDGFVRYTNRDAGKARERVPMKLDVAKASDPAKTESVEVKTTKDLDRQAMLTPLVVTAADGSKQQTGEQVSFNSTIKNSNTDLAAQIFRFSGGLFSSCDGARDVPIFNCTFNTPRRLPSNAPAPGRPFIAEFAPGTIVKGIPMCSGALVDGGPGITSIISVDDVMCEADLGNEPVRIEIGQIYSDVTLGIPLARSGDGSIMYQSPASAEGYYVAAEAWAVSADGTYSWPFTVAIRNHYAPVAKTVPTVEAVRGVDTVIPASKLFSDVDVDHQAESGDHLTPTVLTQPALGGSWFDSSGNLHFQSIDVLHGEYTDHVTVKAADTYGLSSSDLTIAVHVTDLTPGCESSTATTDANTPVRIQLSCSVIPVEGWRQITGMTYAVASAPEFGTLSDFDPVAGSATYTPDAGHPGPVSFTFTAENNGAARTATFAVNVLPAP